MLRMLACVHAAAWTIVLGSHLSLSLDAHQSLFGFRINGTIAQALIAFVIYGIPISGIGLIIVALQRIRLFGRKRVVAGFCSYCGYDLRATLDRCPECGNVPPNARDVFLAGSASSDEELSDVTKDAPSIDNGVRPAAAEADPVSSAHDSPTILPYGTPRYINRLARLPALVILFMAIMVPGLYSSLIRRSPWRCILLSGGIVFSFVFFGPIWGELLFPRSSLKELGVYPFIFSLGTIEVLSILTSQDDRQSALDAEPLHQNHVTTQHRII